LSTGRAKKVGVGKTPDGRQDRSGYPVADRTPRRRDPNRNEKEPYSERSELNVHVRRRRWPNGWPAGVAKGRRAARGVIRSVEQHLRAEGRGPHPLTLQLYTLVTVKSRATASGRRALGRSFRSSARPAETRDCGYRSSPPRTKPARIAGTTSRKRHRTAGTAVPGVRVGIGQRPGVGVSMAGEASESVIRHDAPVRLPNTPRPRRRRTAGALGVPGRSARLGARARLDQGPGPVPAACTPYGGQRAKPPSPATPNIAAGWPVAQKTPGGDNRPMDCADRGAGHESADGVRRLHVRIVRLS